MKPGLFFALVVAAIGIGPAQAQSSAQTAAFGDSAKGMLGSWEFSNAERTKTCTATFKRDAGKVGFKVEFDANCASLFPLVTNIAGWRFADGDNLFLLDADGKPLAEFSEVETGLYEAPTPGVGVLFLQNAAAAAPVAKAPDEVAGSWTINGAQPLCGLTLSTAPAGDGFVLAVKPGCNADIARLNFTRWRLDRDELLLLPPRGDAWRFVENGADSWRRLPESTDPITLMRQ